MDTQENHRNKNKGRKMKKVNQFLKWVATAKVAMALKVGFGAAVSWVLANVASLNLNPAAVVVVIAVCNVLINALNPQDSKYGIKAGSN